MGFDPLKRVNKIAATLYAFIEEKITKAMDFFVNKMGYPSAILVFIYSNFASQGVAGE